MDGGEGGYVDEIILCVWGGGGGVKENPKKNKIFHEEILFFFRDSAQRWLPGVKANWFGLDCWRSLHL